MSQDGSETLPNATNTVSKGVVETYKFEVYMFEAQLLKDPRSQIIVFASYKTYLRRFKAPVRCLNMAQRRFQNATNTISNAHKTPSTRVVEVYRFEA